MGRSKWKGNFIDVRILKNKYLKIKTKSRYSVIPGKLIDKTIHVYNGIRYIFVKISRNRVGFKLGEFSFTRLLRKKDIKKKR